MNKHNKISETVPHHDPYLQYLATFPNLTQVPQNYSHLDNGVTLSQLFLLIQGFKLNGPLQYHPKTFAHKFTNLKLLMQSLQTFWNEQFQSELDSQQIDVVQIAHSASAPQLQRLLSLFVRTAAMSDNKGFFIQKILCTSRETQEFLKQIVQKAIDPQLKESPRKEKEKRMIDRLMDLDHQNQKLQHVINSLCEEKEELEVKLKSNSDLLAQKTQDLQKLRCFLSEEAVTPQKRRQRGMPDTSDRKDNQIDSLMNQITQLNIQHERQMQDCVSEMEKFAYKASQYDKINAELQLSKSLNLSNKQIFAQAQELQHSLSQCKAELMNKENTILIMRVKLDKQQTSIMEMQKSQVHLKTQIQRKNLQLIDLAAKIQRTSPRKSDNPHNLFLEFPQIANTQAQAYIQTNRTLREELERSRQALEKISVENENIQSQLQHLKKCDSQNKRLRQLLIEEKSYKGEEIDVLVHALYHLRNKIQTIRGQERTLKHKNI